MTIRVEKIQLRRGLATDLPVGLDEGELGYATDLQRLFVGIGNNAMASSQRNVSPFSNVEVLTENSDLGTTLGKVTCDNRSAFIKSTPLLQTTTYTTLQTYRSDGIAQDFQIDLPAMIGGSARIQYFIYDSSDNAIRLGNLNILWNQHLSRALCSDKAQVLTTRATFIQFQAAIQQVGLDSHVLLQYTNQTSTTPVVFFRIDRPMPNPVGGGFTSDFSQDFLL